jgi:hypothetical protein
MQTLTTIIRREPLAEIWSGEKKIEYREIKNYWEERLSRCRAPFLLRLINGMSARAPQVMIAVERVRRNNRSGYFELCLGEIIAHENCHGFGQVAKRAPSCSRGVASRAKRHKLV